MSGAYIYRPLRWRRLTGDSGRDPGHRRRKLTPDQELALAMWRAAQPFIDTDSLAFLDETGLNTRTARMYGWSPVSDRCLDIVSFEVSSRRSLPCGRGERALLGARV